MAMAEIVVLTELEIRELVGFGEEELSAVEAVYPLISAGVGSMPPIQRIDVPEHNGEIDIKSAYLPGFDGIAVKVSAGFFDNPQLGLPSLGGLMLVFDTTTGLPAAALFDNGYLTNLRTALAGAVAARHLAPPDASTIGVIGTGVQARLQVRAAAMVLPLRRVLVWGRRPEAAAELVDELARELSVDARGSAIDVAAVGAPADVVVEGGIVVTTTPSSDPLLAAADLKPGVHITAVGSDAEHKRELAADLIAAADLFVCDSRSQSERLGELNGLSPDDLAGVEVEELGRIVDQSSGSGRRGPGDKRITICDLTGTGAQDTAIASLTLARARARSVGTTIRT